MNEEFRNRNLETDISDLSQNRIIKKDLSTQKI